MSRTSRRRRALLIFSAACGLVSTSAAFAGSYPDLTNRWTATATNASIARGAPFTLTWSIAPNGVAAPAGTNSFISTMDSFYGAGPGGSDLTQRPWFSSVVKPVFDRYNALLGINYVYESHDDGVAISSSAGVLNTRGDIRLFGSTAANGTAFGNYPNDGDVFFYLGWQQAPPAYTFANAANFKLVFTHELGHAHSLAHEQIYDSATATSTTTARSSSPAAATAAGRSSMTSPDSNVPTATHAKNSPAATTRSPPHNPSAPA